MERNSALIMVQWELVLLSLYPTKPQMPMRGKRTKSSNEQLPLFPQVYDQITQFFYFELTSLRSVIN